MKPLVANNKPITVTLGKGEAYTFCTCGRSSQQPFCDGSHVGTDFKPQKVVAEEAGDAYLCQCKHSSNLPFCDGQKPLISKPMTGAKFYPLVGATTCQIYS